MKVEGDGMKNSPEMEARLNEFLLEDLGLGDLTTDALISPETRAEAEVVVKSSGILAGLREASLLFSKLGCQVRELKRDGSRVKKGDRILRISGHAEAILKGERTALNLLTRMSGIATLTGEFVVAARKVSPEVRIASTRKTAPGLRLFDKRAVQLGGGDTHRLRLDDCVLIKDNHLRVVGNVGKAVKEAKRNASFTKKIEVEVSSFEGVLEAVKAGADIVMLDNLSPSEDRRIVQSLEREKLRDRVILEASGGITMENVASYARTGVDVLSVGALTHSARALDMSLEIVKVSK